MLTFLYYNVFCFWLSIVWCRLCFKTVCCDTSPCHILRSGKSSENVGALDCLTCSGLDVNRAHRRGKSDSYVEYKCILTSWTCAIVCVATPRLTLKTYVGHKPLNAILWDLFYVKKQYYRVDSRLAA